MSTRDHKVAIVTGGSRGIGAGLVDAYRERGYRVVATSRTITPADEAGPRDRRRRHQRPGDRRADRGDRPGPLRPDRHVDQQRGDLHRQAVHRLHRRGLPTGPQHQPRRVLPDHPAGGPAPIADIVDAVLDLEGASSVTGETVHVDGGSIAGH